MSIAAFDVGDMFYIYVNIYNSRLSPIMAMPSYLLEFMRSYVDHISFKKYVACISFASIEKNTHEMSMLE